MVKIEFQEVNICFDYLSIVGQMVNLNLDNDSSIIDQDGIDYLLDCFSNIFAFDKLTEAYDSKLVILHNNYKVEWVVPDYLYIRFYGPKKDGFPTFQIELTGQGCRELDNRVDYGFKGVKYVYECLSLFNVSISRIDLPIDVFTNRFFTWDQLCDLVKKGQYVPKRVFKIIHDGTTGTIYLGASDSEVRFCIYDKVKERQANGFDCLTDFWIRLEARFKHKQANNLMAMIINCNDEEEFKKMYLGIFYQQLDFKNRLPATESEDHNYSRDVPTIQWWNRFLGVTQKIKLVNQYKLEKSLTKSEIWFNRSMATLEFMIKANYYDKESGTIDFTVSNKEKYNVYSQKIDYKKLAFINARRIAEGKLPLVEEDIKKIKELLLEQNIIKKEKK